MLITDAWRRIVRLVESWSATSPWRNSPRSPLVAALARPFEVAFGAAQRGQVARSTRCRPRGRGGTRRGRI